MLRLFCWRLFARLDPDNRCKRARMRGNDGQIVFCAEPKQPVILCAVVAAKRDFFGFRADEKFDGGEIGVVVLVVIVELLLNKIFENVVIHDLYLLFALSFLLPLCPNAVIFKAAVAALFCFRVILKKYAVAYPDDCEPTARNANASFRVIWKIWDERIFDAVPMNSRVSVEMHCIRGKL